MKKARLDTNRDSQPISRLVQRRTINTVRDRQITCIDPWEELANYYIDDETGIEIPLGE